MAGESLQHRTNREAGQRVNKAVSVSGADLDQTNLLRVSVEAVGFGIDGYPFSCTEDGEKGFEFLLRVEHDKNIWIEGERAIPKNHNAGPYYRPCTLVLAISKSFLLCYA